MTANCADIGNSVILAHAQVSDTSLANMIRRHRDTQALLEPVSCRVEMTPADKGAG